MPPRKPDPHRPAVRLHECPGPGCTWQLGPSVAFCDPDWERLPEDMRERIQKARKDCGTGSEAHEAVIAEAAEVLAATEASR